ncbi:hypothetical protein L208DRAFT_1262742, partial [Tricholoma matsutake]
AAQKLPDDWEDQCVRSFFHKPYIIKEEDIPPSIYVNSDQTQVVYAPGNQMTWADTSAKQVSMIGVDEKRAFTVLMSVAANGTLLLFQAIYEGLRNRSLSESSTLNHNKVIKAGFLLEFSGTKTYWSNQQTMQSFIDNILTPDFDVEKVKLNLPPHQKALWQIDVWSVHRSKEFCNWMGKHHPQICLDFVPGSCTGVHQPCDVSIQ